MSGPSAPASPETRPETLRLDRRGPVLHVTLHRPDRRNAMSAQMLRELMATLGRVEVGQVRAVVLRGSGGHFCAGGDITDMVAARSDPAPNGIATFNRLFGALLQAVEACPAAVIAVCEGAVMGGGFGLACAADVTLAVEGARFRLPETGLGISPAQIAPFLVRRLGLSQARRLAVTGRTVDAREAVRLDLAHAHAPDATAAEAWLQVTLRDVLRCEPHAVAETKRVMLQAVAVDLDAVLWDAAQGFQRLVEGPHAEQGFSAFLSRTPAPWVVEVGS